jgi:hypothetical protein
MVAATRSVGSVTPLESTIVNAGFGTVAPLAAAHAPQTWPNELLIVAGVAMLNAKTGWPPDVETVSSPVLGKSSLTLTLVLSPGINHV